MIATNISSNGNAFICKEEGFQIKAYPDGGRYSIGYGTQYWYTKKRYVVASDTIDQVTAKKEMQLHIDNAIAKNISGLKLNQNQFDSVCSYCYNRGVAKFKSTSLYQMIKANPNDQRIKNQFAIEWGSNQTYKDTLIKRRTREANLYFSGINNTSNNNAFLIILILIVALYFISHAKNNILTTI